MRRESGGERKHSRGTRARGMEKEGKRVGMGQRRATRTPGLVQYLLEAAAPDTVLPAPICTLGVQAGGAVGQEVTGGGTWQWGR